MSVDRKGGATTQTSREASAIAKMMGRVHLLVGQRSMSNCAEVEHELAEDGFAVAVDEVVKTVDSSAAELDGDEVRRGTARRWSQVGALGVESGEHWSCGAPYNCLDWLRGSGELSEIGTGLGCGKSLGEDCFADRRIPGEGVRAKPRRRRRTTRGAVQLAAEFLRRVEGLGGDDGGAPGDVFE